MLIFVPSVPTASPATWVVFIVTALAVCISLGAEYAAHRVGRPHHDSPRAGLLQSIRRTATFASIISGATGMLLCYHNITNGILAVALYLLSIAIFARTTQAK